jgi:hypothetical protein
VLVIVLSILLYVNISNKQRKKRANELKDDNYEYISNYSQITEMTKKNEKNNLGINN